MIRTGEAPAAGEDALDFIVVEDSVSDDVFLVDFRRRRLVDPRLQIQTRGDRNLKKKEKEKDEEEEEEEEEEEKEEVR